MKAPIFSWCQDATPLMCSILSGSFEAAYTLLDAGCRLELRNAKSFSAMELAYLVRAPQFLRLTYRCELY